MKKFGYLLLASSVLLSACGARDETPSVSTGQATGTTTGTGNLTSTGSTTTASEVLTVRVISDRNNIPTGGSDVAVITALVTNEKNQAVAGATIDVRSSGGVLQSISGQTDENGEAKATLGLVQDYDNQDILVTVSSGVFSGTVLVSASGSKFNVAGPDALVLGDVAEITATLLAGNDKAIANREVRLTSRAGNTVTPAVAMTDSEGRVTATVTSQNGDDTITISALDGSASATHDFKVADDILSFADANKDAEFNVNQNNTVTATWGSQGQPVVGEQLRFAITAGQIVGSPTVVTDANGKASATVSSSSAGPATVTVEAVNGGDPATQVDVEFVATVPNSLSLETTSTRVHTSETSTVIATVTDATGNPVKNQEVVFTSADLKGGQLNPASSITNSAGEASVTFTAGDQATEYNEVLLSASVLGTNISNDSPLTVVKRVLNVTIGTSNFLEERVFKTQYSLPFVVQVADGGGTPLTDATVELSIRPVTYYKGEMELINSEGFTATEQPTNWSAYGWARRGSACDTEDDNGNRILDPGEDYNANGALDPQDPSLLAPIESEEPIATIVGGSLTTDSTGSGYFEMLYPVSNSLWADVIITARAQALGAEAEDSFLTTLPLLTTHFRTVDAIPPNYNSPYGTDRSGDYCRNEN